MAKALTARRAARHGVPKGAMTTSPYQRGPHGQPVWVSIVAAREVGCHVELMREDGHCLLVDAMHPVFVVKA